MLLEFESRYFNPSTPRNALISSLNQLLGSKTVDRTSDWLSLLLNCGAKLLPLQIPRVIGDWEVENHVLGATVIWLALSPNEPLRSVVGIATFEPYEAVSTKKLQFEDIHPLCPTDVDLRCLAALGFQKSKPVILNARKVPEVAPRLSREPGRFSK